MNEKRSIKGPDGQMITIKEAAKLLGITHGAVYSRLQSGWDEDELFTREPDAKYSANGRKNKGKKKVAHNRNPDGIDRDIFDVPRGEEYSFAEELRQRAVRALNGLPAEG